ncbi:MAG: ribonuclease D [Pseudomonadota bacterium]
MQVITDTDALAAFSRELRDKPFAAVDTEFMREKTYWPILCLIQAAADGVEAIIDPMAEGIDLSPFLEVMADKNVVKVFHAARQDLEIFYKLMGEVPAPLFDSQIAAMACGYGDQIGYEPLMRNLLNARIDKGSRFTDWARRPLTEAQLSYALSDVTHLRDAYKLLKRNLEEDNRTSWVAEEAESLLDPDLYLIKPHDAWKRLKLRNMRPGDLGPLLKLAEWREREAQERDLPRGRVLSDESIFELARLKPGTPQELGRARSISKGFERSKTGAALLDMVAEGRRMEKDTLPSIGQKQHRATPPADVVDLLKVLLKKQCEEFSVAPKLIASSADLEAIALDDDADVRALQGWRHEIFGMFALQLKRGEIALKLTGGAVQIIPT